MSSKFLKVIFAAVMSVGLIGQANAILVAGDLVDDIDFANNGIQWEYVDVFNMSDGPRWFDADGDCKLDGSNFPACATDDFAQSLNGIEAAELLFHDKLAANEIFALSTTTVNVNHLAFYDVRNGIVGSTKNENFQDVGDADGLYNENGDASAYILDHSPSNYFNYVFKRVIDVPAPATFAIFALGLLGLGARKLKR